MQSFQACVESKPEGTGPGTDEEAKLLIKENLMMQGWCLEVSPSSPPRCLVKHPRTSQLNRRGWSFASAPDASLIPQ